MRAGRRADRAGLDRRHRARAGAAVRHRRVQLARAGPRLPDQPVEDDDRVRPLHGREVRRAAASSDQVGGLEVATTPARWADLHRKHGWATSWGSTARLLDPDGVRRAAPAARPGPRSSAGYHVPTDGLANARRARARRRPRRAIERGARFLGAPGGRRHPHGGRAGHRRASPTDGHVPRGHRRLLRRVLGAEGRPDGRADRSRCCRWPTSTPRPAGARARRRRRARRPRRSCATRTRDLYFREHGDRRRHRLLRAPADAGRRRRRSRGTPTRR